MNMTATSDIKETNSLFGLNDNGDLVFKPSTSETTVVTPSLCFPWMKNNEFISIRDKHGKEVFLIKSLSELDSKSFQAVNESLLAATFMMKIISIQKIHAEFEIRSWTVVTEQGPYKFQTQIDYWPQVLNKNLILIRDVTGNVFYIDSPYELDEKSLHLLWPYLD